MFWLAFFAGVLLALGKVSFENDWHVSAVLSFAVGGAVLLFALAHAIYVDFILT